ncbi:MAG: GmrSD restriction endonuclease domain-containing protein [Solirubrobacterales bacterium]
MHVQNATLKDLIQGEKVFRVPIWQRQYTWRDKQHRQLWHDLMEQYKLSGLGDSPAVAGHFLGSFVLSPVDPTASGAQTFLVIDGQQRLTTLMLVLCALRDLAAEKVEAVSDRFNKLYLINEFQAGDAYFRLQPTEEDSASFRARVQQEVDDGGRDLISDAYRFYRDRLGEPAPDGQPVDVARLEKAVVERMAIVEITTAQGDNAHRIFQSLNGTGVDLNQADLLRNYVFMLMPNRAEVVYEQVWRPMETLLGVDNLAGLARVDLQRRGRDVTKNDVYGSHQRRLDPISLDEAAIEEQVRDLAGRAVQYKKLIDPIAEVDADLSAGLARLARWGAQTSHPVLMVAYDLRDRGLIETEDLRRAVAIIESFLVRRQLVRIPTNALNRLFVQLIGRLPEGPEFVDALHRELSRRRLDWPDDERLKEAVKVQPFFHIGRPHQRKMILERLERSYGHPELIDFDESDLQIEHIMPQTLSPTWRDQLLEMGQDPDAVHGQLLHTLGNLTLTAFNGTLSNNPFERKKEIFGDSHLELNRALEESDVWGQEEILARAEALAAQAATIWLAPLPGISDDAGEGFDWSRVDAAVGVIPAGRWTSYSDLAEVGGTAAQAVGNFVATLPAGTNAYRVLSLDGSVSSSFHWQDPADQRDVREVLEAEGVVFEDGFAGASQRLTSEEMTSLVDGPETDLSLDEPALESEPTE